MASKHYLWFTDTWMGSWKVFFATGLGGCQMWGVLSERDVQKFPFTFYTLYDVCLHRFSRSFSMWLPQYFATLLNFPSCNFSPHTALDIITSYYVFYHFAIGWMMKIEWSSFIVIDVAPLLWMNRLIESSEEWEKIRWIWLIMTQLIDFSTVFPGGNYCNLFTLNLT